MGTGAELALPELFGAAEGLSAGALGTGLGVGGAELGVAGGLGALGAGAGAGGWGALESLGIPPGIGAGAVADSQFGLGALGAGVGAGSDFGMTGQEGLSNGWSPELAQDPTQVSQMIQASQSAGMTPGEMFNPGGSLQSQNILQGINPGETGGLTQSIMNGPAGANPFQEMMTQGPQSSSYGLDGTGFTQDATQLAPTQQFGTQAPGLDSVYNGATTGGQGGFNAMNALRGASTLNQLMQQRQLAAQSKQLLQQYQQAQASAQKNQFPFNQYYGEYQKFMSDPTAYLKNMPGYQASQDYTQQAQARKNAAGGNINSGFGAATLANVLGQNANQWYQSTGQQLGAAAGVGFNPSSYAQASSGSLPYALNTLGAANKAQGEVFKGATELLGNSRMLPDIFKNLG
jgi:hypothetical protein